MNASTPPLRLRDAPGPPARKRSFRLRRVRPIQIFLYVVVRSLIAVIDTLPLESARRVGKLLGRVMYAVDAKHRRIAVKNITRAEGLPRDPARVRRMVRRVYEHLGIGVVELLMLPRLMARGEATRHVRMELRHLHEALARGRGAIVVCAHMGNWELAALAASRAGYPLNSVVRPIENPYLDAYVSRLRRMTGQRIIPKYDAFRHMADTLRRNEILAILADQDARRAGVFVPFFGRPASTIRSPALLALKYGAPIIPLKIHRRGRTEHWVEATPPIEIPEGLPLQEAVQRITEAFTARLESFIREQPEQWMWLHARWKTKPREAREEPAPFAEAPAEDPV